MTFESSSEHVDVLCSKHEKGKGVRSYLYPDSYDGREACVSPLQFILHAATMRGAEIEQICWGTPYTATQLQEKRRRISWRHYRQILDNANTIFSENELRKIGAEGVFDPVFRWIRLAARLCYSCHDFYFWGMRPGHGLTHHYFSVFNSAIMDMDGNRLIIEITMKPGFAFSRPFMVLTEGMLIAFPVILNAPPAQVSVEYIDQGARFDVHYPTGKTAPLAFLRKLLSWPFSSYITMRELKEAHGVLVTRYQALEQQMRARKQAEEALRESEARYRNLVESSPDAILVLDVDQTKFVEMNRQSEWFFGLSREALLQRGPLELSPKEQEDGAPAAIFLEHYVAMALESDTATFEWQFWAANEECVACEVRLARFPVEGRRWVRVSVSDIRKRKEAEQQICRLATALESAKEAILLTDIYGGIEYVNAQFEVQTGYTAQDVLGARLDLLKSQYQDASLYQALWDAMAEGKSWRGELINRRKDGRCYDVELSVTPIFNLKGHISGFVAFERDITARKQSENLIAEQRMKLLSSARLSSLGIMAGNIAHEINGPMATIQVAMEQLKDKSLSSMESQTALTIVQRNMERMQRIVRGLKQLSRKGEGDPIRSTTIKEVVMDTVEICSGRFRPDRINLQIDSIPETLRVPCRAAQLSQVLLNLLNNAVDAVRQSPERWIKISCNEFKSHIELNIEDSGLGIDETVIPYVFEPFYTTKKPEEGTGLGLSISKAIMESYGGALSIDPDASHTRFVLRLPKNTSQVSV